MTPLRPDFKVSERLRLHVHKMACHHQHLQAIIGSATTQLGEVPHDVIQKLLLWLTGGTQGLCLFRPDDSIAYASPNFARQWDIQPHHRNFEDIYQHCYGAGVGPIVDTEDIIGWLVLANSKRRSAKERSFEIDMRDGTWFWAVETTFEGGWLLVTVTDITPLKANEKTLRHDRDTAMHWAHTDVLTGLNNRRYAVRRVSELLTAAVPFCIALIDLDHFKSINDRHGHDAGDLVLQHFSDQAVQVIRGNDFLARIGGEEFLLVMPNATPDSASLVLDRLRTRISQDQHVPIDASYTFSSGLALSQESDTFESLYSRVDEALYRAKAAGRNKSVWEPVPIAPRLTRTALANELSINLR